MLFTVAGSLVVSASPKTAVSRIPGTPVGDQFSGVDQLISAPAGPQRKVVWASAENEKTNAAEKTANSFANTGAGLRMCNNIIEQQVYAQNKRPNNCIFVLRRRFLVRVVADA